MIKEFSFGNYRSFKEIQSLNMTASKIKEHIDSNVISVDTAESLLKSKAVYGANSSGKSNIVKALATFIAVVTNSVKDDKILRLIEPFQLSTETDNAPSFFQLIFEIDGVQYRYGFEASGVEIKSEWLMGTPNEREVTFFIREHNSIVEINEKQFSEGKRLISLFGKNVTDSEIFRKNSLFLSVAAAMNGNISKKIVAAINGIIVLSGLQDQQFSVTESALENSELRGKITAFLKLADTGINSIELVKLKKDTIPKDGFDLLKKEFDNANELNFVFSKHDKYDEQKKKVGEVNFHFFSMQSEGTLKMLDLSSFIINAIAEGGTLVIDEFDARLHPLVSKKIVELFNSKENIKSQLIFVTHDTNLLSADLLRRDQIDFVEKDKYGESHLYSLVQFKGIRNTASFQKDYIQGKYGAIPFLGNFNNLFISEKDA